MSAHTTRATRLRTLEAVRGGTFYGKERPGIPFEESLFVDLGVGSAGSLRNRKRVYAGATRRYQKAMEDRETRVKVIRLPAVWDALTRPSQSEERARHSHSRNTRTIPWSRPTTRMISARTPLVVALSKLFKHANVQHEFSLACITTLKALFTRSKGNAQ